mmetsp:Transcript_20707/g.52564  ORF Transcript_20707/g.52564 Transcript_20707/m.52564 type:complete len:258 (+) Transcript_20707:2466-3239(+)
MATRGQCCRGHHPHKQQLLHPALLAPVVQACKAVVGGAAGATQLVSGVQGWLHHPHQPTLCCSRRCRRMWMQPRQQGSPMRRWMCTPSHPPCSGSTLRRRAKGRHSKLQARCRGALQPSSRGHSQCPPPALQLSSQQRGAVSVAALRLGSNSSQHKQQQALGKGWSWGQGLLGAALWQKLHLWQALNKGQLRVVQLWSRWRCAATVLSGGRWQSSRSCHHMAARVRQVPGAHGGTKQKQTGTAWGGITGRVWSNTAG